MPATLPAGFVMKELGAGLQIPTAMALAPDGRFFVSNKNGIVQIVKNEKVLPTPFLSLNVFFQGERGLTGITLDPNFATNHYVYVYYTPNQKQGVSRVSRFTADGDIAVPGSEKVLLQFGPLNTKVYHHVGGSMLFGKDGKLYIGVGDNQIGANAQNLSSPFGKVLRINSDGSIPADNPFVHRRGANPAVWAYGLRNPFTMGSDPVTGQLHINDVGLDTWEEINVGRVGANYGWPGSEGPTRNRRYTAPLFAYMHGPNDINGSAITGGTFYRSAHATFPSSYVGDYFFSDFSAGWIHYLDANNQVHTFATGMPPHVVGLIAAPNGDLDLLSLGVPEDPAAIYRVSYSPPGA